LTLSGIIEDEELHDYDVIGSVGVGTASGGNAYSSQMSMSTTDSASDIHRPNLVLSAPVHLQIPEWFQFDNSQRSLLDDDSIVTNNQMDDIQQTEDGTSYRTFTLYLIRHGVRS
jgi:hypothetical protein